MEVSGMKTKTRYHLPLTGSFHERECEMKPSKSSGTSIDPSK